MKRAYAGATVVACEQVLPADVVEKNCTTTAADVTAAAAATASGCVPVAPTAATSVVVVSGSSVVDAEAEIGPAESGPGNDQPMKVAKIVDTRPATHDGGDLGGLEQLELAVTPADAAAANVVNTNEVLLVEAIQSGGGTLIAVAGAVIEDSDTVARTLADVTAGAVTATEVAGTAAGQLVEDHSVKNLDEVQQNVEAGKK